MSRYTRFAAPLIAMFALLALSMHAPASAAPAQTEIRMVTPVLTAENSYRNWDDPGYWVSQGWFPDGISYRQVYAPIGSMINTTWLVTDPATKQPLPDTTVTLRVNKGYSVSNAKIKVGNSMVTTGVERTGIDQLRVTGKTDQFGYVTFQLFDMDDPKDGAEPQPAKFNQKAKTSGDNPMGDPNIALFTQLKPEILGEKNDIVDFVEFHFYKPNGSSAADTSSASVKALAPGFTESDSVKKDGVFAKYAPAGQPIVLAYSVVDAKGAPLVNRPLELTTNAAGSGGNAAVGTGSTAPTAVASKWTAQTDAFGNAVVVLTNGVTKGESKPSAPNATPPTAGAVFARLQLAVQGIATTADAYDFHFFQLAAPAPTTPPAAKKITIKCQKGTTVKKVTAVSPKCPSGYKKIK